MYRINGTVFWKHDEYVSLDLFEDYSISDAAFECKLKSSLTSTLKHIPTITASFDHSQNDSKLDTALKLLVSTIIVLKKATLINHDSWQLKYVLKTPENEQFPIETDRFRTVCDFTLLFCYHGGEQKHKNNSLTSKYF